ncbi:uncharacterized protein F5147DRAFT_335646 [Suillus discolor]|uniref:Uncharacterized protein n=1 Tax=Suillus discolor TaxID=1912936 RepID=A0A9P7JQN5_9AGAM|nr:uncharacterized protein F5147DRAFT_335646 [Suillus discolor]KAG2099577.1 hypothetical protein F5147DRAFT_335646 [Suillus discolor]
MSHRALKGCSWAHLVSRLLVPVLTSAIHDPTQLFLELKVPYLSFSNYFLLQTVVRTDLFTSPTAEQVSINAYTSSPSDIIFFTWGALIYPPSSRLATSPSHTTHTSLCGTSIKLIDRLCSRSQEGSEGRDVICDACRS